MQGKSQATNEFELKFQVPPERSAAVEAALRRGAVNRTQLHAKYFDTADQALARHGLVLRLRQEGRKWIQTAKGPGNGGFDRLEHNAPVGGSAEMPDPERHQGHPIHEVLRKALAGAAGPLVPTFETDVVRLARTVNASGTQVEIALDRGHVRGGGRSLPLLEMEFELKQGSPAALVELAQSWCAAHGLWLDPLSKSGLGRRLASGESAAPPTGWPAVTKAGGALLPGLFDAALQQVLGNARELAAAEGGDAHVHQLRIGLRRLRTALRELQPLQAWSPLPPEVEPALRILFSTLGAHRDQSTLLPELLRELAHEGNPMREWRLELPDVGAAVRDPGFQSALLHVVALAQALREDGPPGPKAVRQLAREQLQKLHRKMVKEGRRFEALTGPERHQVRKRLKRLRYLAELVRPVFHGRDVDRYVDALKELQDALGLYQDAVAGRSWLMRRVQEDPAAWFGVGWLAAREHDFAAKCEVACRRTARRARIFWD